MGRKHKPPRDRSAAARLFDAEERARALGVRLVEEIVARVYRSQSQSLEDTVYTQERGRDGWRCSCEGYRWTGCCKHLGAVSLRAEREGWDFGHVAGLHADMTAAPENVTPLAAREERRRQTEATLRDLFGVDAS